MHKELQPKSSFDAKSEAAKTMNGANGYSVYTGPAPVSGSTGFTWAKRRKDAPSTLSDGSRSKISGLDPNFAKGTYDLTKHGIDVAQRNYSFNSSLQDDTKHVFQNHQARHAQRESFDVADTYHSNDYLDFDPTEKADSQISTQVNLKSSGKCKQML